MSCKARQCLIVRNKPRQWEGEGERKANSFETLLMVKYERKEFMMFAFSSLFFSILDVGWFHEINLWFIACGFFIKRSFSVSRTSHVLKVSWMNYKFTKGTVSLLNALLLTWSAQQCFLWMNINNLHILLLWRRRQRCNVMNEAGERERWWKMNFRNCKRRASLLHFIFHAKPSLCRLAMLMLLLYLFCLTR